MTTRPCYDLHPVWLAAALTLCAPVISLAQPASPQLDYDLPAAPLARTLNAIAQRSGVAVSTPAELVSGRQAAPVQGRYNASQAFDAALAQTDLQAVRGADGSYMLRPRPPAPPVPKAAPADAPESRRAPEPGASLPAVIIVAKRDAPGPATVNTVKREEIERFAVTSTSDLFTGIPGVTAANARNGVSFDLNIRGMQSDRIKVLVDGTQSTSNTSKSYGGENNHNYVDPDLISSIVVEKGPSTGPNGAGTGGGVVSLSTLTADDLLRDGKNWGLRLRGGWANNSAGGDGHMNYQGTAPLNVSTPSRNLSASMAGAWRGLDGKLDLMGAHSRRRSGNYQAGDSGPTTYTTTGASGPQSHNISLYKPGSEVFNTSQETESTLLKARLALPADQWIELSHNRLDTLFGEARLAAFDYNIEQKPLAEVTKTTWLARYGWQPADNPWWNLRANVWQAELDELHPEVTYGVSGTTTTQGLEAWNTSTFDIKGVDLSLAYGGTWQHEKTTGLGITEPRGERDLYSLFTRVDVQLSSQWALEAGLRRESYTTDGTGSKLSPVPGQGRIPYKVADGHSRLNPTLGVTFKPWQTTEFYARYSEGWRPPTPKEVGLTYARNSLVLQPEETTSIEVGTRLTHRSVWADGDTLNLGLAWFNNRHDNYLVRALDPSGNTPYYYDNIDAARFKGVELNARYDNGRFFSSYGLNRYTSAEFCGFAEPQCTDSFSGSLSLALSGLMLPPRYTQTLTVGGRWFDRQLTLGLRAQDVGSPAGRMVDSTGQTATLGWERYAIYDLFGNWHVNRHIDLNFSVENLGDRYYIPALSSPAIAIPSPGRTAKLTLTYQF